MEFGKKLKTLAMAEPRVSSMSVDGSWYGTPSNAMDVVLYTASRLSQELKVGKSLTSDGSSKAKHCFKMPSMPLLDITNLPPSSCLTDLLDNLCIGKLTLPIQAESEFKRNLELGSLTSYTLSNPKDVPLSSFAFGRVILTIQELNFVPISRAINASDDEGREDRRRAPSNLQTLGDYDGGNFLRFWVASSKSFGQDIARRSPAMLLPRMFLSMQAHEAEFPPEARGPYVPLFETERAAAVQAKFHIWKARRSMGSPGSPSAALVEPMQWNCLGDNEGESDEMVMFRVDITPARWAKLLDGPCLGKAEGKRCVVKHCMLYQALSAADPDVYITAKTVSLTVSVLECFPFSERVAMLRQEKQENIVQAKRAKLAHAQDELEKWTTVCQDLQADLLER